MSGDAVDYTTEHVITALKEYDPSTSVELLPDRAGQHSRYLSVKYENVYVVLQVQDWERGVGYVDLLSIFVNDRLENRKEHRDAGRRLHKVLCGYIPFDNIKKISDFSYSFEGAAIGPSPTEGVSLNEPFDTDF